MASSCLWTLYIFTEFFPCSLLITERNAVFLATIYPAQARLTVIQSQSPEHSSDMIGSEFYPLLKCCGLSWNFHIWFAILLTRSPD